VVAGIGPGRADRHRHAVAIHQERVLGPLPAAIDRARPGRLAAAEGPGRHAVDDRRVGVQLIGLPQEPQEVGVEPIPDAGLLPGPQPAVGGPAGAAEFRRDILPAGAGGEHEPDDSHGDTVCDSGPPPLGADGLLRRQVMRDDLEEFLRHLCTGHCVVSLVRG
jgi:hypothetical protein